MRNNLFMNPIYERPPDDPYAHLKKLPKWIKDEFSIQPTQQLPREDQDFIYRILVDVLEYPDKRLAQLHKMANILGRNDLKVQKKGGKQPNKDLNESKQNIFTQDSINDDIPLQEQPQGGQEFCKCCGFMRQRQGISICQPFQQFPTIGLSTFLYFRTILNCIFMLLVLFVVYSLFGMFINYYVYIESQGLSLITGLSSISLMYDTILSYKSIEVNYVQYQERVIVYTRISAILIMVVVVVWSFLVYLFKHFEVEYEQMIDDESVTASDFGIVIERAPIQLFKDISNVTLQFGAYFRNILPIIEKQYFDIYLRKNTEINTQQQLGKLRVTKINIGIPFYLNENNLQSDQEYKDLLQKLQEHKQKLIQWVVQFFEHKRLTVKDQRRQKRLTDYKQVEQKIQKKKQTFMKALERQYKQTNPSDQMTTTVFVTFQSALAAKIVYELNPNGFLPGLKYYLTCCNNDRLLNIKGKNGQILDLKIERAPEPEDIIWQNIGFSFGKILLRRLLTYFITIAILVGSFFLITFLSEIQLKSDNFFIGIAISITLTVLNIGIGLVIYTLTVFEKDFTHTNYQASLALKSVFAQLINCLVIPVFIKQNNIYGRAGLVEDVFWLIITCAFIDPILKFADVYYLYTRIRCWLKFRPYSRVGMDQEQLNSYAQKMEFEAGFEYIYVANLFLISCFFTPIQPIAPVFSIIGLCMMYWSQKYSLLNRMKRPVPGSDMVNVTIGSVITLGPIMLGVGNMIFSDFLSAHGQGNLKFLLHIIAISVGVFFYLLPFKLIYRCIFSEDEVFDNLSYFQNRILLPSEYDRINPATSQQGMEDFMKYLKQINNLLANQSNINQNQSSGNNRLVNNLAKFVEKSQKNPQSKQVENLKHAAANMQQNSVLGSLLGPKQKGGVHGLNQQHKSSLALQLQKKLQKPGNQQNVAKPQNEKPQNQKSQNIPKSQNQNPKNIEKPKNQQPKQSIPKKQNEKVQSQFLRQQYKKKTQHEMIPQHLKQPIKNNEPFVKEIDQTEMKVFQKKPTTFNDPFQNLRHRRSPQKNEGIFGMQIQPYKKQQIVGFDGYNNPQKVQNQQRKLRTEAYEQLQDDSPYKQKVPQRRSQKFNFIKVKSNKAPKVRTQSNQINFTNEDINSSYRQQQEPEQRPIRLNLDKSISPQKHNSYQDKAYISPTKIRPVNNPYQQKGNTIAHIQNDPYNNKREQKSNTYNLKRNSVPYNQNYNDSKQHLSNQKLNSMYYEDLHDQQQEDRGMQFNGYSIDYQKQRRRNSKNNPYASIQANKNNQERSWKSYQRSNEF